MMLSWQKKKMNHEMKRHIRLSSWETHTKQGSDSSKTDVYGKWARGVVQGFAAMRIWSGFDQNQEITPFISFYS